MTYLVFRPRDLAKPYGDRGVEFALSERDFRTTVLSWILDQNLHLRNWQVFRDDDHTFLYADCVVVVQFTGSADAALARRKWAAVAGPVILN